MSKIRVKVISKYGLDYAEIRAESMPGVEFIFTGDSYDWLVVYDDLPSIAGESLSLGHESIRCSLDRTILLTYEPSSIKYYGSDYVRQFAHVLTSHDQHMLIHPNRSAMPPVGIWYYGGKDDVLQNPVPPVKTDDLSVFYSGKTMTHSLHDLRNSFIHALMDGLGDALSVFGKGYCPVDKKRTALDSFRYHVAIENHRGDHHWTEKLSDCFLGYCVPIYAGCTNLHDYFPERSYIQVDPRDIDGSVRIITEAIAQGYYERHLPDIQAARQLVLSDYSLGSMLSRYILQAENKMGSLPLAHIGASMIRSRHLLMRYSPLAFVRYAFGKMQSRRYHRHKWRDYKNKAADHLSCLD